MKISFFIVILGLLGAGLARAEFGYSRACMGHSACAHSNSKECRDARQAFADHHNGLYPEAYCNQWYQGQRGRWIRYGNEWRWAGIEGDQWFEGHRGHWFRELEDWIFRDDDGNDYRKDHDGHWGWVGGHAHEKHDRH